MCGRFTFQPTEEFYQWFQIVNRLDGLVPRYNIAPRQMVPVIISQSPTQVVLMRWGLIPHWTEEEKTAYKMINARVETIAQRPAFRGLLAANRCLVPASGFYEWKGDGRDKTPYYSHSRGAEFLAFAGLYDVWTKANGEELSSFTIITKDADEFIAHLHNRMPVILQRDLEDAWLDTEITNVREVLDILARSSGIALDAYPVSRMVNKPSVDGKGLSRPAE